MAAKGKMSKSKSKSKKSISMPLVVGIVMTVILALIIAALIIFFRKRSRKLKRMGDPVQPQGVPDTSRGQAADPEKGHSSTPTPVGTPCFYPLDRLTHPDIYTTPHHLWIQTIRQSRRDVPQL
ncbi:hypothetical protein BDM02DRAFT_364591 [Thelephora ganbajun]|uniref:Uncharacterized protein n=1 Tax=Thelephora ganbajun TaxID=370292 RepID=A0ACB6ZRK1_THEGA|nr:hypothetical protein BDM02DRAFT_364591 [Thelephora ganbajun]